MKIQGNIITVGLSPAWDLTCQGNNLRWGEHPVLDGQHMVPAGRALNVSRALAWLGHANVAAGLWGQEDHQQMQDHLARTCPKIQRHMTPVAGRTRINVTVLDQSRHQELHLRSAQSLVSRSALETLDQDLHVHHK